MKFLLTILISLFIIGCTSNPPINVYTKECSFLKGPIYIHDDDVLTPGTFEQILYITDKYFRFCATEKELKEYLEQMGFEE